MNAAHPTHLPAREARPPGRPAALLIGLLLMGCQQPAQPPTAPVPAPEGVSTEAGDGAVTLAWKPVEGAESYRVYWSRQPGVDPRTDSRIARVSPPWRQTGLDNGQTYHYVVVAVADGAEGPPSQELRATPVGRAPAPAQVQARASRDSVQLGWKPVEGADGYSVYWSSGGEPPDANRRFVRRGPFLHKGLAPGTSYRYTVAALRDGREGRRSGPVRVTPGEEAQAGGRRERRFEEFVAVIARAGDTLASLAREYLGDPEQGWRIADFNGVERVRAGMALVVPLQPFDRGGLGRNRYQTVPVLTYHNFTTDPAEANILTIPAEAFRKQLRYLEEHGYRVITADQLLDFIEFDEPIPDKSVVITIDDGWRSTYEIALPILKEFDVPATVFIYTDFIGQGAKALTWDMIAELHAAGLDIECHTKSHRDLTQIESQEPFAGYYHAVDTELRLPSQLVDQHLDNGGCDYLAYPYGATSRLVVSLAEKHGYRGAFTVERGSTPFFRDAYRINRSMIYGTYDLERFEANLAAFGEEALQR